MEKERELEIKMRNKGGDTYEDALRE